ncbi:MAG TPA: hypothetical protein VJ777_32435 [Mycobacterium sp.]|nr:hypothetical protein [Mycobacterium sp.]
MPVRIEFDKPRTLHFDIESLSDLEAAMGGKPLLSILSDILRLGVTAITASLWAGLKHEDKGLNQKLVGRMLGTYLKNGGKMRPLANALDEALGETGLFDREDTEGNAQPEPATVS